MGGDGGGGRGGDGGNDDDGTDCLENCASSTSGGKNEICDLNTCISAGCSFASFGSLSLPAPVPDRAPCPCASIGSDFGGHMGSSIFIHDFFWDSLRPPSFSSALLAAELYGCLFPCIALIRILCAICKGGRRCVIHVLLLVDDLFS